MIFGGSVDYEPRRHQKLTWQKVKITDPVDPTYPKWSGSPITFDRSDYPDHVPQSGHLPLMLNPIIGTTHLTKVFMDGSSTLNIIYIDTFNAKLSRSNIRLSHTPFHGIILRERAVPLGQITLPVTFGDRSNFRTEKLTLEVVDLVVTYHAILSRPCYTKFIAVLNYVYLKLKTPGPKASSPWRRASSLHSPASKRALSWPSPSRGRSSSMKSARPSGRLRPRLKVSDVLRTH